MRAITALLALACACSSQSEGATEPSEQYQCRMIMKAFTAHAEVCDEERFDPEDPGEAEFQKEFLAACMDLVRLDKKPDVVTCRKELQLMTCDTFFEDWVYACFE